MFERRHRLLALCAIRGLNWSLIAREAQRADGLERLFAGRIVEHSEQADAGRERLVEALAEPSTLFERVEAELDAASAAGASLVTVLDDTYPSNLRLVFNLPPFLFYRGELQPEDAFSVAVVGTRQASSEGLSRARQMASGLVSSGVTVVSGLAAGIDTAAHEATLRAGGRTVAVLGTGITRTYPRENAALAERICERGALVSQFWPSAHPSTFTFPRRNVVTSGISQGTVVIEATSTSGAKMQARLALEHGKRVFLLRSLVTSQPWARKYLDRGAIEVAGVEEVVSRLSPAAQVAEVAGGRRQLALDLG